MNNVPRVITVKYGLRDKVCEIYRDVIPMNAKMAGLSYKVEHGQALFFDKNSGAVIAKYIQFDYNKYKLVVSKNYK